MEQVQCPNCGGYKVYSGPRYQNIPLSGSHQFLNNLLGILCVYAVSATIAGITMSILLAVPPGPGPLATFLLFSGAGILVGAFVIGIIMQSQRASPVLIGYDNLCNICGYKWYWQIGTPKPTVKIEKDLLKMGDELLGYQERTKREQG